jgi:protein-disulfide isomerase/rhodanese-related sulfurtransferase
MRKTLILALSFIGLFASSYLLWVYTSPSRPLVCLGTGCDVVRASEYAYFHGVPLPLYGTLMYATLVALVFAGALSPAALERPVRYALLLISGAGFAVSLYLTGIEAFVLHAYCAWCVLSAVSVTGTFVLALLDLAWPSPGFPSPRTCLAVVATGTVVAAPVFYLLAHAREGAYQAPSGGAPAELLVRPDSHATGNLHSPVTVVEFADFECPACGRAQPALHEVMQKYGDRVRFVFRQFPMVAIHAHAEEAAMASECAAQQGRFWQAVDFLYNHQKDLSDSALKGYAFQMGLDVQRYIECLSSKATLARVREDEADGRALGVRGTPTFFVGRQAYVGPPTAEQLAQMIDAELARQAGSNPPGQSASATTSSPAGGIFDASTSATFTPFGSSATACSADELKLQQPEVIHTADVQRIFQSHGSKLFVDVRSPAEFAHGHVPGAVNIPVDDIARRWNELPKDEMLVLYESGKANPADVCAASRAAGRVLLAHGFSPDLVRVYEEGLAGWEKAGLPVQ